MATLILTLDRRRARKNGTYPLVFRISVNGETRDIPTGHSIDEKYWNSRLGMLKKIMPAFSAISEKMKELGVKYLSKKIEYEKNHPWNLNAQELKDYILSAPKTAITVYDFWQQEIEYMQKVNRNGGARVYMEKLSVLNR